MASVLVPLADGFEEMEGMIIIDVLRRGGVHVTTAGLTDGTIVAARKTRHIPDMTLDEAWEASYDMVVLPGGGRGAELLGKDSRIATLLKKMDAEGKYIGAICAAPNVLRKSGIIHGEIPFTMFPDIVSEATGGEYTGGRLVQHGRIVTSVGPGSAFEFALHILEMLAGQTIRKRVEEDLHLPDGTA